MDLDIPETAMHNKPLTGSILGSDGIWDDFCMQPMESNTASRSTDNNKSSATVTEDEVKTASDGSTDKETSSATENDYGFYDSVESLQNPMDEFNSQVRARNRNILTLQKAQDIYLCFLAGIDDRPGASVFVGRQYGVSPKTIWDIWNR